LTYMGSFDTFLLKYFYKNKGHKEIYKLLRKHRAKE
jgi:hypothetical protein